MKVIYVQVEKYQTEDGRIFDSAKQAEHHERIISGVRRICPKCNGTQQVPDEEFRRYYACPDCDGRGYVEKQEVWK